MDLGDPLGIYENSKILAIKKIDETHFYMTILLKGNEKMDKVFSKAPGAFKGKNQKELVYKMEITPAKKYFCRAIIDSEGKQRREGFIIKKETQDEIDQWLKDNGQESL